MIASLPASIAYAPLSTLVPLLILNLGGSALNVAFAVTSFNAVAMVTTFIWGKLADTSGKRKPFILLSYAGITALLFLMYFARSIIDVANIYAAIALFQSANVTPYNLLVMETEKKENWSKSFSRLQAIVNFGMIIGLVIGSFMAQASGLRLLVLIFAFASLASTAFAAKYVIEPKVSVAKKESVTKQLNNMIFAVFSYPLRTIRLPQKLHIPRFGRLSFSKLKAPFALMCISWLFFNVGMSMFNTIYPASLYIHGLSESMVFVVILVGMIVETLLFYYALKIIKSNRLFEITESMTTVRAVSYVFVGLSFFVGGLAFFIANVAAYTAVAGLSYPLYYTASYTLLFMMIGEGNRGSSMGIYNGIGWAGYFVGSFLSGIIVLSGFTILYITSGIFVLASVFTLRTAKSSVKVEEVKVPLNAIEGGANSAQ